MALRAHAWPGNIRELENVIHFGLIVCKDKVLRADDLKLSPSVVREPATPSGPSSGDGGRAASDPSQAAAVRGAATSILEDLYAQFIRLAARGEPRLFLAVESALVHAVFSHCHNNQVQSAKVLGVSRNTLRTLLKQHGLLRSSEAVEPAALGTPTPSACEAI